MSRPESATRYKIVDLQTLSRRLEIERSRGRSVALANGLFDLLHVGHLRYLEASSAEADLLVVAVNSDRSARALKGPGRPLVPQSERAELIAGFACVAHVVIFDEDRVDAVLHAIRPDVHCKGTDYSADTVPEAAVAREVGARIAIVGDPKDHATREIIGRIRGSG